MVCSLRLGQKCRYVSLSGTKGAGTEQFRRSLRRPEEITHMAPRKDDETEFQQHIFVGYVKAMKKVCDRQMAHELDFQHEWSAQVCGFDEADTLAFLLT